MVLGVEERVTLGQMLKSFTRNGAFAARLEDRLGSLEAGKVADVVVLDRDLFEIAPEQVGEAKVLLTLFEGREIYRAPEL
jgi:predicted amidohydrolase YtcJ